ncbi:hypothetical protein DE146DRAFT_655921 [Phaeosphaeria sp. MPI-PUGE-AT-0046c]|nr:hypothetical protein DE146DRAFT_655921 [Phaeosphaeria sp. MPI-PUGE-AT-0046c]
MLSQAFPCLLAFIHLTCALPTSTKTTKRQNEDKPITELWTIPRLDMHIMSVHTGFPGDEWLPGTTFDSTIDFDILMPNHTSPTPSSTIIINCSTSFANGTLPSGPISCTSPSSTEVVLFELYTYTDLGPRRPEMSFWLDVTSAINYDEETRTADVFYWGQKAITANDPGEESSYLTCIEGRPFDGLRCQLKSYLSVDRELEVEVERIGGE